MSNLFKSREYQEKKNEREQYFVSQNLKRIDELIQFKNYTLEISHYKTKDNDIYISDYTRGIIRKDNKVIADIKRNYYDFPYLFIEHENGNDYLICGEYNEGYTIINLTNEKIKTYIANSHSLGRGLCLQNIIEYNKYSNKLTTVNSTSQFGFLGEIVIYDFSDPDNIPLSIITRCENYSYY